MKRPISRTRPVPDAVFPACVVLRRTGRANLLGGTNQSHSAGMATWIEIRLPMNNFPSKFNYLRADHRLRWQLARYLLYVYRAQTKCSAPQTSTSLLGETA